MNDDYRRTIDIELHRKAWSVLDGLAVKEGARTETIIELALTRYANSVIASERFRDTDKMMNTTPLHPFIHRREER